MRWGALLFGLLVHNTSDDGVVSVDHHREAALVFVLCENACRQNPLDKVKRCLESRFIAELPPCQLNHLHIEPEYSSYGCSTACSFQHNP